MGDMGEYSPAQCLFNNKKQTNQDKPEWTAEKVNGSCLHIATKTSQSDS